MPPPSDTSTPSSGTPVVASVTTPLTIPVPNTGASGTGIPLIFVVPPPLPPADEVLTTCVPDHDASAAACSPPKQARLAVTPTAGANLRLELQGADGQVYETQHAHDQETSELKVGDTVNLLPTKVYVFA